MGLICDGGQQNRVMTAALSAASTAAILDASELLRGTTSAELARLPGGSFLHLSTGLPHCSWSLFLLLQLTEALSGLSWD